MPDLTLLEISTRYATEDAAREYFERLRWPHGPACPHCGNADEARIYRHAPNPEKKIRPGLFSCAECRKAFTVTVGTVMEDTHLPLRTWLLAWYMMAASKTQVSALQLQRQLEIGSYRSAWHLCHRIRHALREDGGTPPRKLSGEVEADETYIGGKRSGKGRGYVGNKTAVVSIVERGGEVRSQVVPDVDSDRIGELLLKHVELTAHVNSDESPLYTKPGRRFRSHRAVNHSKEEWSRTDPKTGRTVTTNTAEGYFGNSKRSLDGTHHHVSAKHLPRYFAELDFKYNTRKLTDGARTADAIGRMQWKRLTLRDAMGAV